MANKRIQVVFASAEAAPFVKTGGLGDVAGSLPKALGQAGADVIVMVPKYGSIAPEYTESMTHLCDFYVPLGWRNEYCGLELLDLDGVRYLFIDNERYFKRDSPYGFFDDGERFAFFSKAVTESLQHLPAGFTCDVLHCNDWHTALAPVFLREFYQGLPTYERVRTVFSIHNIAFQGQFSDRVLNDILGLAHIPAAAGQLRCDDSSVNYMQGALHYADAITTVSPTYSEEIRTPGFGEGLDPVLRERSAVLSGILNGIDVDAFDPATDARIAQGFTASHMAGKRACKAALQEELGLEVRQDRPLMIMVSRLTRQKGLDLVTYSLERILSGGVQVAVLGTGERTYEDALNFFASLYPGVMAARIQFNPALSHRMYAGADMLLMPSLFEPCGLAQMIAMRYATLPIVRETGGLKDTVKPYNRFTGEGTGFSFSHFNGDEMGDAVFRAARLFWDDRKGWSGLVAHAMAEDFSWVHSASRYLDLYRHLLFTGDGDASETLPAGESSETESGRMRSSAEPRSAKPEPCSQQLSAAETRPRAGAASDAIQSQSSAKRAPEMTAGPVAKTGSGARRASGSKSATSKRASGISRGSGGKANPVKPSTAGSTTARVRISKRGARGSAERLETTSTSAAKSKRSTESTVSAPPKTSRKAHASADATEAPTGSVRSKGAAARGAATSPKGDAGSTSSSSAPCDLASETVSRMKRTRGRRSNRSR
ncbi:glycogen/starch synthase, ADP-glucose type [Coriobacterium glomerans PW2]|uniref:Glycogen synthase n=1 Tax=Coriobacterium glomerans (strain ATCC 49209 / DSM 20642 / JCM 10262 / PW2) TaxID=700015 RepID=F2N9S8_CORGP|nr:glycogen synthase GlgA [Coriobacterium glomerans]AEB07181.1 glycogen/starch synthase, ADP-glucose type [Coriobacterium glomerans PW2]